MAVSIYNCEDTIDSRNIIERIDELESWRDDAQTSAEEAIDELDNLNSELDGIEQQHAELLGEDGDNEERIKELDAEAAELEGKIMDAQNTVNLLEKITEGEGADAKIIYFDSYYNENEHAELQELKALADQCEGYGDWQHGEALIRYDYFQTYAQDLAEDIGAINGDASWPNDHIDWESAADALKQDYMCVDFDGVEYWMRS